MSLWDAVNDIVKDDIKVQALGMDVRAYVKLPLMTSYSELASDVL